MTHPVVSVEAHLGCSFPHSPKRKNIIFVGSKAFCLKIIIPMYQHFNYLSKDMPYSQKKKKTYILISNIYIQKSLSVL